MFVEPKMKSLQNILLFVEPWIELSDDFRYGSFSHLHRVLSNLQKFNPNLNIKFLISDSLYQIALHRKLAIKENVISIPLKELEKIYPSYKEAAHHTYHNTCSEEDKTALNKIIKKALKNWTPDLILMHETHAPYLKDLYPKSLTLHCMFGMTHQAPFPQTFCFDHQGLYKNSILAHLTPHDVEVTNDETHKLKKIKNWYAQQIIPHDPVWTLIQKYQAKYEKLILLPLQVDHYYAFDECSPYRNQYEFLVDVMQKVPENWGVVVTGHSGYQRCISDIQLQDLKLQYPNLIQEQKIDEIPSVSQAVLPHVDAVISISSSIGLQTLLFNKPLITAGLSHINALSHCDLKDITNVFNTPYDEIRNFKLLKFFFCSYHLIMLDQLDNAQILNQYLNTYFTNFVENKTPLLPTLFNTLDEYYEKIIHSSQWRAWQKNLLQKNIPIEPNPVLAKMLFHDFISWDLFDTLVDRPFVHPHEVFQSIEDKARAITRNIYLPFHMLRRESERTARGLFANHRREVTFDEIYQAFELKTKLPKKHIEALKKLELDAEFECIRPRRLMQKTWEMAKVFGKVRTIITDIYLDESFIKSVLYRNGYSDYDQLLVSAEEKHRKEDGSIYPDYLANTQAKYLSRSSFFHIGDNPRADGEMARKYGINTYIIPKAIDQLKNSAYAKILEKPLKQNSYDTSLITGLIANKLFSSPKANFAPDSISNNDLYNLGYSVVGPFITSYIQWVIRRLQSNKTDKAYFLARDGYLVMQIYKLFKEQFNHLPEYEYLLCSRRGVVVPGFFNIEDILETAMLNYGITTVGNFLNSRYGLNTEEIPAAILKKYNFKKDGSSKISFPSDIDVTNAFVTDIQKIILKRAEYERKLYVDYLKEKGLYDDKNIALVDLGYSGTMQRKLKDITGKSFIGLYMLTHNYVLHTFRNEIFEGWLGSYDSQRSSVRHPFNDYIPLLESMLSSTAGSFLSFELDENKQRTVNYLYSEEESYRCFFVKSIQLGALDFAKDFVQRLGKLSLDIELSPHSGSHIMFEFGAFPPLQDVKLFEGLLLENMFAGSEFSVIANVKHYLDAAGHLSKDNYTYLVNKSKWKAGAIIAYQKYLKVEVAPPAPKTVAPVTAKTEIIATKTETIVKKTEQSSSPTTPQIVQEIILSTQRDTQLSKYERLQRKLVNNPKGFIEDSKILPKRVAQMIISHEASLSLFKIIANKVIK